MNFTSPRQWTADKKLVTWLCKTMLGTLKHSHISIYVRPEMATFHKVVTKGGSTVLNNSDMQCSVSKSHHLQEL